MILRAIGSRVPEAATSPVTQDVPPPRSEKQIIPTSEIPEGSRPKHGSSGTCSKFQTGGSREERSTASCYSRSSQGTKRKQKVHKDLGHKLNAKRASQTTAASSGVNMNMLIILILMITNSKWFFKQIPFTLYKR